MARLTVSIVAPQTRAAHFEADMVTAPSVMGELGILPGHRSLLADLQPGVVTLRAGEKMDRFAVSGGFIEVERDHVTILAETVERGTEIDVDRARASLKDAEAQVKKLDPLSVDYADQMARTKRNQARVAAAEGFERSRS
jgi:F-type H+-transporting ATPase subunit epsilon